jgi:hypothetical protein
MPQSRFLAGPEHVNTLISCLETGHGIRPYVSIKVLPFLSGILTYKPCRTSLRKTLKHMEPCLPQLYWEATKPLFQLQQATMSIIHSTPVLEMPRITSGTYTATRWHSSRFWPFPRVRNCVRMHDPLLRWFSIADKQFQDTVVFRKFHRQLFHSSLARILLSLHPWMTKPRVTQCGDGYFRRVIYGLGPYIADYPKQALLACIVSGWCPKYGFIFLSRSLPASYC